MVRPTVVGSVGKTLVWPFETPVVIRFVGSTQHIRTREKELDSHLRRNDGEMNTLLGKN